MTRPDLDTLAALLDKGSVNIHDVWTLVAAVEPLLAYVRELERDNADLRHDIGRAQAANAELATAERAAALAMRERCAQACEQGSVMQLGPLDIEAISHNIAVEQCAAAIRALEP